MNETSDGEAPAAGPSVEPGASLTSAVKSAILDQLIRDLAAQVSHSVPHSFYAKSDSGLYGKYQKFDVPDAAMLSVIHDALESMVREAEVAERAELSQQHEGRTCD